MRLSLLPVLSGLPLRASLVSLVAVLGCSAPGPGELGERDALGSARAPIMYGTADTTHPAVAALFAGNSMCSGTIIKVDGATGWFLTAGHCVESAPQQVVTGQNYDKPTATYPVSSYKAHPKYSGNAGNGWDFALVKFSKATAATPVLPYLPASLDTIKPGDVLEFVGYGVTEKSDWNTIRNHVKGTVGKLSTSSTGGKLIEYTQAKGGPCNGDSGGPSFTLLGGIEYVSGITSYGDGACTEYGASGRVSAVQDWIDSTIGGPGPTPGGTGGSGGSGAGGSGTAGSGTAGSGTGTGGAAPTPPVSMCDPSGWECDPVATSACGGGGMACDVGDNGDIGCFGGQNVVAIGGACHPEIDLYCKPGGTCVDGTCKRMCCSDADCGGTKCESASLGNVQLGLCGNTPAPPAGQGGQTGQGGTGSSAGGSPGSGASAGSGAPPGGAGTGGAPGSAGSGSKAGSGGKAGAAAGPSGGTTGAGSKGGKDRPEATGKGGAAGTAAAEAQAPEEDVSFGEGGGCSTTTQRPEAPGAAILMGLAVLASSRRKKRD